MSSTIADLIESAHGTRQLIPWQWLTSNAKKTMEVVFQFAFDEEQDFSRGFAIHHLRYVDTSDVRAIKYLDYRHVLFAIEEIQKIADNSQYSDLPTIDDSEPFKLDTLIYSFSIYDDLIRKASNVEDLIEAILNRLDAERPMSERDRAVLAAHADWVTSNPQTLDAIGHDFGLTRERIRQIIKKFDAPIDALTGELRFAIDLSRLALKASSMEDLQDMATKNFLSGEDLLDLYLCKAIMAFLPASEGWGDFVTKLATWENQNKEFFDASRKISKFRGKMGFIDAVYAAKELELPLDKTISAIKEKYPRSVISRNLVLARTENIVSTFESSVAKQLLVSQTLPAEEILAGARRHASLRNDAMTGENSDYLHIIHSLSGNPPTLEKFRENQLYKTELSESDNWLVKMFSSSESGLLHRVEITKYGIESKMSLGSITAYCGSSPFIRTHSNGIYSLIGVHPSIEEVSTHAELALSQDKAVEISLEFVGSNILFILKPNLNTYASGVVLPNRELKELFVESVFSPECTCGPIDSKQILKLTKEGFWTGFQSIFSHALHSHDFHTSSVFKIFFDFDRNKAILNP